MKILGIDPGYDRLGIAVIEKSSRKKESLSYSTCFQTSSKQEIYERFKAIGTEIARVIEEWKPDAMAIESLFMANNQKTAMRVSEARGIIIYEAVRHGIPVHEYTPMEIKTAITGDGTSDKARMMKMLPLLMEIPANIKRLDDEYDAMAAALTHSARVRP